MKDWARVWDEYNPKGMTREEQILWWTAGRLFELGRPELVIRHGALESPAIRAAVAKVSSTGFVPTKEEVRSLVADRNKILPLLPQLTEGLL